MRALDQGKTGWPESSAKGPNVWAIRVRLQMQDRVRELALFDLGIDSKLRGCDLVRMRVRDVCHGDRVASRAMVMQQKTHRPVQFEVTPPTRDAVQARIRQAPLRRPGGGARLSLPLYPSGGDLE